MSGSRRDPHKSKLRRERIRRENQSEQQPEPPLPFYDNPHPFASERAMREIQALTEGQEFDGPDQLNEHLQALVRGGRDLDPPAA